MNREEPEKTFFLHHPIPAQPYHQSSKQQTPGQANKTNDEDIGNKLVQINYQTLDNGLFGTSWLAGRSSPFASNSYPKTESMLTGTSDKNNEDKLLKGVQSYSFIHSFIPSVSQRAAAASCSTTQVRAPYNHSLVNTTLAGYVLL